MNWVLLAEFNSCFAHEELLSLDSNSDTSIEVLLLNLFCPSGTG